MTILYEYYNTGADNDAWWYGDDWAGQTFTPSIPHKITSVKLSLYRINTPGVVTVSIRLTNGNGLPAGNDLCSGTTNGDTLTTSTSGEWREITLGAGYNLAAGTKYVIVVRAAAQTLAWLEDTTSPTYSGGNQVYSNNAGSTWSSQSLYDYMFEEWGDPLFIPQIFII